MRKDLFWAVAILAAIIMSYVGFALTYNYMWRVLDSPEATAYYEDMIRQKILERYGEQALADYEAGEPTMARASALEDVHLSIQLTLWGPPFIVGLILFGGFAWLAIKIEGRIFPKNTPPELSLS